MHRFILGFLVGVALTVAVYAILGLNPLITRKAIARKAIEAAVAACHTDPVTFDRYYVYAEDAIAKLSPMDQETFDVILSNRINLVTAGGGPEDCRK